MSRLFASVCVLLVGQLAASQAVAELPLHERIDAIIAKSAPGKLSLTTSDEEFVRRIYLDLTGRIPSRAQAKAFIADVSPQKRVRLVDALIKSTSFPKHMANVFHIMLLERRGEEPEWQQFLVESFESNKPWNQMAKEIVAPDPSQEAIRGAAFFYTKRLEKYGQNPVDYPGLVRDVGRMFLGVDVQCAQCHDHLFIDSYKQVDYQGLFAFVGTTFIRRDTKFPAVGEKPLLKKIEFESVFEMEPMATGPRIPGGVEVSIPAFKRGDEYKIAPDKKTKSPGVLKFSPLQVLGEQLTQKDNQQFARNISNRLWWTMMGRGIVDPLDLHHVDNPPSHPELLDLLTEEITKHEFDMQFILREIALSETYQRSSLLPAVSKEEPQPQFYQTALERPLSAKQLLDSVLLSTGMLDQIPDKKDETESKTETALASKDSELPRAESYDELLARFRAAFANPPREPEIQVNSTVKAALFLMHDPVVLSWLEPKGGNLVERLTKSKSVVDGGNELYMSILSRRPTTEELAEVEAHLMASGEDRGKAWGQLAWALLASTEFFVNH